jgi:hypothetical protein
MADVMFEWADGPNANAEFHKLHVFSPAGERIQPRMQQKAYHKNGQWSYADQYVYVPAGSLIFQSDQSTHGSSTRQMRLWVATSGRPEVFSHRGQWAALPSFPQIEENPYVSQEIFEKVVQQIASEKVLAQWAQGAEVEAI